MEEESASGLKVREGEGLEKFEQVASKRRSRTAIGSLLIGFAFFLYVLVLLVLVGMFMISSSIVLVLVIIASVCLAIGLYYILYFPPVEL